MNTDKIKSELVGGINSLDEPLRTDLASQIGQAINAGKCPLKSYLKWIAAFVHPNNRNCKLQNQ